MPPRKEKKQADAQQPDLLSQGAGGSDDDKKKALEGAIGELTKKYGDGTVVRLGDAAHMQVDTIPTGSLAVDIAIGVGGIPRGRITEIYGPESSGKCVSKDTYCLTDDGLLSIEELFAQHGQKATCTSRVREVRAALVNELGTLEATSHFTWNNRKPVKRIRTRSGMTLEATHNHRVRVMNTQGYIVWRQAGDLKPGDYVVTMRGTRQFGRGTLTADEAKLLGYLIADGTLLLDEGRIAFSNSAPDVMGEFNRIMGTLTATPVRQYAKTHSATVDHHVNDTALRAQFYERYPLDYVAAAQKTVPLCVRMAGREAQIAFLRGYFELECSIELEKSTIEATSASPLLLRQIQLMLLNLGLLSILNEKPVNGTTYYRLTLSGVEFQRFGEVIGFESAARRAMYQAHQEPVQVQTNVDAIPHLGDLLRTLYDSADTDAEGSHLMYDYMGAEPQARLTYDRLARVLEYFAGRVPATTLPVYHHLLNLQEQHFFFDRVETIEDDEMPTFDVVMPETHSFWSNGFISHNTTICLHVIAEAQKRGGLCAFIDMEHALDPQYAARLGVNMDTLYVAQPDTGEQALEITETLVRSGALDVIVVDSVAALVPRAEIEGEMGDSHVGLQARLMSQALRKLSGAIKQSHVSVLFTNQLREKVGVMWGSPETTTGGRALKFYASVRLDVRRVESIKSGDEVIGNRTKVRVTKNKVSAPFREAEFDIMFYEGGISKAGEILDLGIALGLIDKRGAFLRYNDGLLGQGRENAKQFLRENPAVANEIEAAIRVQHGLPVAPRQGG